MLEAITTLQHKSDWETPIDVFEFIEKNYLKGKFSIDLCASKTNHKCAEYVNLRENIFKTKRDFKGHTCFMNPPYTKANSSVKYSIGDFLRRGKEISDKYKIPVAILVFSNISSTKYFQKYVGGTPHEQNLNNVHLYFLPRRIAFEANGKPQGLPPFASMVVMYR